MKVSDLFRLRYGHSLELNGLTIASDGGVAFVGRAMTNNGVTARVEMPSGVQPAASGELTVALGGAGVLYTFVQPEPFYTGRDVMILSPIDPEMSTVEKLWWAAAIRLNAYRYSYNRQANKTLGGLRLPDSVPPEVRAMKIPAKVTKSDLVPAPQASAAMPTPLPPVVEYKSFQLAQLFDVRKGSRLTRAAMKPGDTPYVGSSAMNNGVTARIHAKPAFERHTITVPYNGSVGYAFLQEEAYCAGDDVHVLVPRESGIPRAALLFVCAVVRLEAFRYGYGYKWTLGRMAQTTLRLPVDANGAPDWRTMAAYMSGLPFSAALNTGEPTAAPTTDEAEIRELRAPASASLQ